MIKSYVYFQNSNPWIFKNRDKSGCPDRGYLEWMFFSVSCALCNGKDRQFTVSNKANHIFYFFIHLVQNFPE